MAIIKYPDWLPLAQRASKNLTQQTPFRSDQPAVGAPIFQKLTTDIAATWSLTWIFTLAEERAFIQWLRSASYLNKCNNWFTMMIDLGGSGLQEQTLHFTDYPVQTSIDGGVVTWTGNVIAKKLNNTMDEFDDALVELDYRWYSWLDEVVNRELPQVYMTPILHMPINMLASTLDSRIVYEGPRLFYIDKTGDLVITNANEWPLTFIDGVAVGRAPPELAATNLLFRSGQMDYPEWVKYRVTVVTDAADFPTTTTSAEKIVETTVNNTHFIQQTITTAGSTTYTFSVFLKAGERSSARVYFGIFGSQQATNIVTVDISGQTITSATDTSRCGIMRVNDDWVRVYTTITTVEAPTTINGTIQLLSPTGSTSYAGDGTSGFYAFGAQMELGGKPTSYISTTSAALTRGAATAKVAMNGATSIDITYSDGTVVNVQAIGDYAAIPQADSAWGSKYITTIKFNV